MTINLYFWSKSEGTSGTLSPDSAIIKYIYTIKIITSRFNNLPKRATWRSESQETVETIARAVPHVEKCWSWMAELCIVPVSLFGLQFFCWGDAVLNVIEGPGATERWPSQDILQLNIQLMYVPSFSFFFSYDLKTYYYDYNCIHSWPDV